VTECNASLKLGFQNESLPIAAVHGQKQNYSRSATIG